MACTATKKVLTVKVRCGLILFPSAPVVAGALPLTATLRSAKKLMR